MKLHFTSEENYKGWASSFFLFCTALFIRLPFFFRDYIDRDESTFILMGQSIADGYLPYVHLWDLKPPLLFYVFGLVEYLFPGSFIAIRFLGVLVVFLTAVVLFRICMQSGLKNGFLIALLYVILSSEFGNLQALMSEHLAIFFLLSGYYLFQKRDRSLYYFLSGIALGCALLCKLSLAYGLLLYILVSLVIDWKSGGTFKSILNPYFKLAFGLLFPFVFIIIPFFLQGKQQIFIDSVFWAPLEYSQAEDLQILEKLSKTWWIILAGLLISIFIIRNAATSELKQVAILLSAIMLGIIYTFFSSGIVNGHYLVQVYPFMLLLVLGILVKRQFLFRYGVMAALVVLVSVESLVEYYKVGTSIANQGTPYYREGFNVVKEIKKHGLENEKIFFIDYHIGYWLLDQYPLTKSTTHPSNIKRSYLFKYFGVNRSTYGELKYLLDSIRPAVVVSKSPTIGFIPGHLPEKHYFDSVIAEKYTPLLIEPERSIYMWRRN